MVIFLAGASRGVGREVAKCLREENLPVVALLRSPDSQAELAAMGIQIVMGDALDPQSVDQAMQATAIDTVITTIGGMPQQGERPDYLGNKNLIDAAVKAGVKKFILVSSIGTGNSKGALSPQALETLEKVLIEKEKAEHYLINSGLTYTIIRPGGLKSEEPTGNAVLTESPKVCGMIHRPDVARLVCACLKSETANNKVLSAIDPNMQFVPQEFERFNL
jgi:nucleoside-diphosphate-sugar epimerase